MRTISEREYFKIKQISARREDLYHWVEKRPGIGETKCDGGVVLTIYKKESIEKVIIPFDRLDQLPFGLSLFGRDIKNSKGKSSFAEACTGYPLFDLRLDEKY